MAFSPKNNPKNTPQVNHPILCGEASLLVAAIAFIYYCREEVGGHCITMIKKEFLREIFTSHILFHFYLVAYILYAEYRMQNTKYSVLNTEYTE